MKVNLAETSQETTSEVPVTELRLLQALAAEREARREAERLLSEKEELIARNEILMREVDHRVKNSLQLVATMLSLQARRLPDGPAVEAINNARERVLGIAAVHEQLYQASTTDSVDMRVFLEGLCRAIARNRPDSITAVEVDADPLLFGSKRAAKIGMLVVELVTNAFKHAYTEERGGNVRISLKATDHGLELAVSDDGVGLGDVLTLGLRQTLGMQIVRSIATEIGGALIPSSTCGAHFSITFPR